MSMKFKSLDELGKGAWKLSANQAPLPKKEPSALKGKSTHILKEILDKSGPQAQLTTLIKAQLPDYAFEENKKDAVPDRKFEIDIAFVAQKLAVEVDGWQYHGKFKAGFSRDREKQNLLVCEGWRVLRFTAKQIYNTPYDCIQLISKCLKQ